MTRARIPGNDRLHQARPIARSDLRPDACAARAPIALRAMSVELAQHDGCVPGSLLRVSMLSSACNAHSLNRVHGQTRGKRDVREAHDGLHEEAGAEVRRQHTEREAFGPPCCNSAEPETERKGCGTRMTRRINQGPSM